MFDRSTAQFWSPTRHENDPARFSLTAKPAGCVGPKDGQFLMGGVAMAAAIEALEHWSGKPLLWASIQFLTQGLLGDKLEIAVDRIGGGRSVLQASAQVTRGGAPLQHVMAALGTRGRAHDRQFTAMPDVPAPDHCPLKDDNALGLPGNLLEQFERRTALEDEETGTECMWIRPVFDADVTAPLLALMSDFFLGAHERSRGGTSLDNTFRLCALKPTGWILSVTQLSSFTNGAVHGVQHHFGEDGTLLATSSQTGLLPKHISA